MEREPGREISFVGGSIKLEQYLIYHLRFFRDNNETKRGKRKKGKEERNSSLSVDRASFRYLKTVWTTGSTGNTIAPRFEENQTILMGWARFREAHDERNRARQFGKKVVRYREVISVLKRDTV